MGFKRCAIVHARSRGHDKNMSFKRAFFSLICLFCMSTAVQARLVKQMYEVSLPVVSQDKAIRKAAFEQAFIETLVRVSGNGLAPTEVNIASAARYVQQYRYLPLPPEMLPKAEPSTSDLEENTVPPQHLLWVQFNPRAIKKLLRDNALPIWGQQRPEVLVWLAVRDGPNRYVLRRQDISPIKAAVEEEARRRGLPIIWPYYDQQDQALLGFADIWGGFWEPLNAASQRYGVDAILLGQMVWQGMHWQIEWSLQQGKQPVEQWQLLADDLNVLMAGGIDNATDQIASQFAVLDSGVDEGDLIVQVEGIEQLDDYARVNRYLSSLSQVKHVFATQVEGQQVQFNVDLSGDKDDLQRVISLGKTLLPVTALNAASETQTGSNQLRYQLKP